MKNKMNIKTLINFCELRGNQWLTAAQLHRIQNQKLSRIIKHAYENVSYYRRLFKAAGILPENIQDVHDLQKIPITYKSNLQNQDSAEFLSQKSRGKIISMATSGETGFPLEAKLTESEYVYWKLLLLRVFLDRGVKLTDSFAVLAHPFRFPQQKRWFQYFGILRHKYISALEPASVFTSEIIKAQPDIIMGYAGALKLYLLELERMPQRQNKKNPRLIFSSAEKLDNKTRELAKQILNCNIVDLYSTVETGPIAWECECQKGYHINIDSVVVECIDKNGKPQVGLPGRIVCTNLFNFTMPFIRYCLDDVGTLTDAGCDCPRGFPLLESIKGKTSDFLVLQDRVISPAAMESILEKYITNARYRVIQHTLEDLDLELLPGLGFNATTMPSIAAGIKDDLGRKNIKIRIKIVDPGFFNQGKFRSVISHVPTTFP